MERQDKLEQLEKDVDLARQRVFVAYTINCNLEIFRACNKAYREAVERYNIVAIREAGDCPHHA